MVESDRFEEGELRWNREVRLSQGLVQLECQDHEIEGDRSDVEQFCHPEVRS